MTTTTLAAAPPATEITLIIWPCWHWGHSYRVTFEGPNAEDHAIDFYQRKADTCAIEIDEDAPVTGAAFPRLLDTLFPTCEHGMSAHLCAGPGHYPMDH